MPSLPSIPLPSWLSSPFAPRYAGTSDPAQFCSRAGTDDKGRSTKTGQRSATGAEGDKAYDVLSEDPNVKVLLIEAGESDQKQLFSKIPAGWIYRVCVADHLSENRTGTAADWNLKIVPQAELNNRELYQPRGKMLGGCSAMNAQIYHHCAPEDYDQWETLGAEGWNYEALKPYFRKAEGFTPTPILFEGDATLRGKDGVWKTTVPPTAPLVSAFLSSGVALGLSRTADFNTPTTTTGIGRFTTTIGTDGRRSSTSRAYLPPSVFQTRNNLDILTSARCTRLVLATAGDADDAKLECTGVELVSKRDPQPERSKQVFVARVKPASHGGQVIVSLGAFATPQLLLCSGIGSRDKLSQGGVDECKIELEGVGEGLKEHVMVCVGFGAKKGASMEWLKSQVKTIPSLVRWFFFGTGPLATNVAEGGAFLRSNEVARDGSVLSSKPDQGQRESAVDFALNASSDKSADLEVICAPVWFVDHALLPVEGTDYCTMASTLLKPFSTGSVSIRSPSMLDEPVIDPKYLADKRDMKVLLAGLHLVRRLALTEPLSSLLTHVESPDLGSLEALGNASDEALEAYVREKAETVYHPQSTAKIGPRDKGGVADANLRVHGTLNSAATRLGFVLICDEPALTLSLRTM
ncbi:hypothetical protein Rhopal_007875-T1 [Rhodotorula paludigena]|uniref:Glucose-methanol-choline oxidoreductase N-terminal domain-containing protein n=1 Tax=Rhodotorula paludigena TaxID=86838 RepID=A0AAV5GWW4_9BASI|nr:hypothetical protein Rhopal_007875-T1 [Rhodotorula paludigena]